MIGVSISLMTGSIRAPPTNMNRTNNRKLNLNIVTVCKLQQLTSEQLKNVAGGVTKTLDAGCVPK